MTDHPAFNVKLSPTKPDQDMSHTNRPLAPIIEDWVSDSEDEYKTKTPQNVLSFIQPTEQVKSLRPSVQHVETSIPTANPKTSILKPISNGKCMNRKACFVCKSLDHLIKDCDYHEKKMAQTNARNHAPKGTYQHYARMSLTNPQRHVVPTAVVPMSKLVPINAARPITTVVPKIKVTRSRQDKPSVTKPISPPRRHINRSPSPKANTFPPKVTALKAPKVNAAKGNPQHALKDKGVIDSGCSRRMTGSMSYLSDFEELNGRYVAFGGNPKGGKISKKGKIRTGKLDFNDVYFVKELKFNLFSISQMCDKKNGVLFTDTQYLVLSSEFKLPNENQVLLRIPRENNMYNVNLKNIVPSGDLTSLENQLSLKVKVIRSDNGTEFKNNDLNQLCRMKRIKREFSVLRTPQQNDIAKRKNMTLIEAARTILEDSLLPIPFWAKAVNTACYVQNRVLVTKPQIKSPYELLHGRKPSIGFMRPFGCLVTILNALDSLGKFNRKVDEGFLVEYSNTDGDAAFDEKEPEFEGRKPESEVNVSPSSSAQSKKHDDKTKREAKYKSHVQSLTGYRNLSVEFEDFSDNIINEDNAAELEDVTYSDDEDDVGAEADFNNLETSITVSHILTTRVYKDHHVTQIIGDRSSATQTKSMTRVDRDQGGLSQINNDDFHTCMFACFLLQEEPKRVHQALKDPSWIEAMQEELLQFKMQKVWVLVDLPHGKRAIHTKWVFINKKDERGSVVRNKARLVAQGHTREEGIDYEKVFAPVARIEAIRLFLAYASFVGFMDLRTLIILTRFTKWSRHFMDYIKLLELDLCKAFEKLIKDKFQMSSMGELTFFLGLQVKQKKDRIFISQDKYVVEILRKFGLTDRKSASTPIDTEKPLLKDPDGEDVDVHTYRSMISSLMYLTSSRPDIMFAVCACAHFQVTPKASHLHAVKRIFRYLKGKPHLGLWYLKDSPFNLVAYSDSNYAGASLDRKSTTGGCQFLGCRLISWQCKKQTVIATSSTEAEYVAAASCCVQVLWIQNQLMDYGYYLCTL
nr:uncharacterized mitochondrial protein AtMg00810-like [Tanacetum cinerariifolium]